ncbi:MAG: hypothetical protein PHE80_04815 [Candidatus Omnitrophica bacterium]|nr:hypothetical protein [Candidatus Omnitrophota bacterium]
MKITCLAIALSVLSLGAPAACARDYDAEEYELNMNDSRKIPGPSDKQITDAINTLSAKKIFYFVILSRSEMDYIQVCTNANGGYDLEYQEGDTEHHYAAVKKGLKPAEIIKAFIRYRKGDSGFKKITEWEKIKW